MIRQLRIHPTARALVMRSIAAAGLVLAAAAPAAQEIPLEQRVKAAYLFNFTKFVEWPADAIAAGAPLTLCVAAPSPFGQTLEDTVRGELVGGRALTIRVVRDPAGCHVLFVPGNVTALPLLRDARTQPILTVGESPEFLHEGGVVKFVMHDGKVKFEISQDAAARAHLRISSRLLRLARPPETR
jgi:YfiR/HmsC-like